MNVLRKKIEWIDEGSALFELMECQIFDIL
jgi:hypothetical protein